MDAVRGDVQLPGDLRHEGEDSVPVVVAAVGGIHVSDGIRTLQHEHNVGYMRVTRWGRRR